MKRIVEGLGFVLVLTAIVLLVIGYEIGKEFERIAAMKGYPERKYFWWSFLVPAAGMLMVVALPNRSEQPSAAPVQNDQLPEL